jgi:hypothetical protein
MAEANQKVMDVIRAALAKNPDASNQDLFEKAKAVDPGVADLSPRQFNARYPLQVKRTMAPTKPAGKRAGRGRTRGKAGGASRAKGASARPARRGTRSTAPSQAGPGGDAREKVRAALLELARDVASAEGRGDVVAVVMGIDRYVDRVMKATG